VSLTGRVQAALEHPPLSEISASAREELAEAVAAADDLDELPGKWQAAILRAEGADAGGHSCASC
jgi:hypothetical protein